MYYIVTKQSPRYHQMTLEELLFGAEDAPYLTYDETGTRTYTCRKIPPKYKQTIRVYGLVDKLREFNATYEYLRNKPRQELYYRFFIPKHSGGLRKIDAPNDDLKKALYALKDILEDDFHASYHTAAFAYIKKRSTISAVKKHQSNESKWFGKFDLSNFFGSTTLPFVMSMLSRIFPFCLVTAYPEGKAELEKALELAFLDGGLPQGTPISPLITNIMMIPIDHALFNKLADYNNQSFVYTRYADDFIISSRRDFNVREIEEVVKTTLLNFEAPFNINEKKTRYGSSAGRNFNLGIMLNKDNEMTIGRQRKRQFESMLFQYAKDTLANRRWEKSEVQVLAGLMSYYKMIEGKTIDAIVKSIGDKNGIDLNRRIKSDLKSA